MLSNAAVSLLTVIAMEGVASLSHRYVMHGFGWGWHASHHGPRSGRLEKNDWFAVVFASFSVALIWFGTRGTWPLQWVGAGMTLYGLLYFVAHDGLVHGRWRLGVSPKRGYLKRLIQAHRLHHAVDTREGAVSFGFLWAPSPQRLKRELAALRERRGRAACHAAAD